MAFQPEIVPSSEQGQQLQAAIQKQLAFHGWSTDDDTVMAEYCLVMLGNRKTAGESHCKWEAGTPRTRECFGERLHDDDGGWVYLPLRDRNHFDYSSGALRLTCRARAPDYNPPTLTEPVDRRLLSSSFPPPDQISTELSDLIGTDFDPSFVSWLFTELSKHYPDPSLPSPAPAASAPTSTSALSPNPIPVAPSASRVDRRAPRGGGTFGAAMQGVKRDAREMENAPAVPLPNQRVRYERPANAGAAGFEGVPAGPRVGVNGHGQGQGQSQGQGQERRGPGGKSIFERVGPGVRNGGADGGPAAQMGNGGNVTAGFGPGNIAFDAITTTIEAVARGAHPSLLASIPFAALASHPQAAFLNPAVLQQAQAHAMAQAQAFAAMQGQQIWSQGGGAPGGRGGFNGGGGRGGFQGGAGQQAHFNPNFRGNQIPPPPPFGMSPMALPFIQQHQQPHPHPAHAHAQAAKPVVPVPTKPLQEEICKHGVECSRTTCPYSHPSPVATKDSGLVLSSEACEKMLECVDKDCPKSHVSPSIVRSPPPSNNTSSASFVLDSTPSSAPPAAMSDASAIPGAGEKSCKFGAACTRKGCVFLHPWDAREGMNGAGAAGGVVMCRWAEACTRADCHFSHPPSRPTPKSSKSSSNYKSSPYSTTFHSSTSTSASTSANAQPSIGEWPKEEKTHVSERLKRFNMAAVAKEGAEEEVERIIPGEVKEEVVKEEVVKGEA